MNTGAPLPDMGAGTSLTTLAARAGNRSMCSWRAGCGGSRTSGSEGDGEETTGRKGRPRASPSTLPGEGPEGAPQRTPDARPPRGSAGRWRHCHGLCSRARISVRDAHACPADGCLPRRAPSRIIRAARRTRRGEVLRSPSGTGEHGSQLEFREVRCFKAFVGGSPSPTSSPFSPSLSRSAAHRSPSRYETALSSSLEESTSGRTR